MAYKTGAAMKEDLESAHAKAMEQQRANTPMPGMGGGDGVGKAPKGAIKTTGTFKGKSNRLGGGGRFAQLAAKAGGGAKGAAIAAAAGRAKYGAKKMAQMSAAGRK